MKNCRLFTIHTNLFSLYTFLEVYVDRQMLLGQKWLNTLNK